MLIDILSWCVITTLNCRGGQNATCDDICAEHFFHYGTSKPLCNAPTHSVLQRRKTTALGWGLLSQFSPFRYFPHFPLLSKQTLAIEYHVYFWQVSPQLSCGDTCQKWMWFRESNRYFCKIENFAYGEISERSFSNPTPDVFSDVF